MKISKYLLLLIFSFLWLTTFSQHENIRFEKITSQDGLSQNIVNCLLQDDKGFVWIGTVDGLNKFDGYSFTQYKPDLDDPNSLVFNWVYNLIQDEQGMLWIATRGGLSMFNPKLKKFTNYVHDPDDPNSLSHSDVLCVLEDKNGQIWAGTNGGGLNKFNRDKGTFTHWKHEDGNPESLSNDVVRGMCEDSYGVLWLGTFKGLNKFDRENNTFKLYEHLPDDTTTIPHDAVQAIIEDQHKDLWIGTDGGLCRLFNENRDKGIFTRFTAGGSVENPNLMRSTGIYTIYEDSQGTVWLGTWEGGMSRYNREKNNFTNYLHDENNPYSISYNTISSIMEDDAGVLWVGTWAQGVNTFDMKKRKFEHYYKNPNNPGSITNNNVASIWKDRYGILWIGSGDGGGLMKLDREKNTSKTYKYSPHPDSLQDFQNCVYSLYEDKEGTLWVGTRQGVHRYNRAEDSFTNFPSRKDNISKGPVQGVIRTLAGTGKYLWIGTDKGLSRMDTETEMFKHYVHEPDDPNSLTDIRIRKIYVDHKGWLWVGTAKGLNHFNPETGKSKQYLNDPDDPNTLNQNYVWSVCEGENGIIWIGTNGGGLNKLDTKTDSFTTYRVKDGLPNESIWGVLPDQQGNIWISTSKGLSKFNPETEEFLNFDIKDGLQGLGFNGGAYHRSDDGEMFFGGLNGFNAFYPSNVTKNDYKAPVVITSLQIFNKPVPIGKKSPLSKAISYTDELVLSYKDYVFSFEFAALHYSAPHENKYAYKLENFDEEWIETGAERRFAPYANLEPGDYIFKVKGTNSDGLWNEDPTTIKITVTPPFWKTWWFKISMAILILGSAFAYYRSRINRIKKQKEDLEKQVKERTAEVVKQKNEIEQKNTELQKLSIVASQTDNAVIIMDANGNFEWFNEAYTRMFGVTLDELKQRNINIIGPNTDKDVKKIIERCLKEKHTVNYEFMTTSLKNKNIWVQVTLTPVINDAGKISKLIAIDSDISKIKEAEKEIQQKSEELRALAENLQETNQALEREKEHTMGSIRYGLTIQQAILPIKSQMDKYFDSFIIFRPKDIVSGDFYWFSHIPAANNDENDKVFLAVVDCTGHGVPGAFMSMIGNRLLNEIVNEKGIYEPAEILTKLNKGVKVALKQDQTDNNDGMDLCLCRFENTAPDTFEICYAGAKRPVFYHTDKTTSLEKLPADRKSIGGVRSKRNTIAFKNKEVTLNSGDTLYLATDGLIDQNAPDRRRFGTPKFVEIMKANQNKPLAEQCVALEIALDKHQQDEAQRDDITVIGVKLKDFEG